MGTWLDTTPRNLYSTVLQIFELRDKLRDRCGLDNLNSPITMNAIQILCRQRMLLCKYGGTISSSRKIELSTEF